MAKKDIAIIGDGGWGTALGILLYYKGYNITQWGAFPEYIKILDKKKENAKFLSGVEIPGGIKLPANTEDLKNIQLGNNILVGNSAHPENNHLDIAYKLKTINLSNRKIIVPLSYGDNKYKKIILKKYKNIFGNKFKPLLDFISIKDYLNILKSCNICIMGHLRQQA